MDYLTVIDINGVSKTRIEHYGKEIPNWAKHLHKWGEAGTVKTGKDGKIGDRGVTCIFIGYANNHEGNVFRMCNEKTSRVTETRDVIFLQRMYFQEADKDAELLPEVYIETYETDSNHVFDEIEKPMFEEVEMDTEERRVQDTNSSGQTVTFAVTDDEFSEDEESEDEDEEEEVAEGEATNNDDTTWVVHTTRSGSQTGRRTGRYDPATGQAESAAIAAEQNYYARMMELDEEEIDTEMDISTTYIEYANVGAGVGGGYENTNELKPMTYAQAMKSADAEAWKKEIANEHNRMVASNVFTAVKMKDLPPNTKLIDSTWACKKKSNGTLRGRINARGFKQVEGAHYDGSSIHAPVTNSTTIRVVLTMMIMAGYTATVVDVKGAFLHGEFQDGEEIYMKVPQGFEEYYESGTVLRLNRCIYGLKQAAMAFWRQLLMCMKDLDMKRSTADPCLYYKRDKNGLVMVVSWIDDNLIIGDKKAVEVLKTEFMRRFECEDCGELDEYVGCKIERTDTTIKFTQPVLLQSFEDEFDLPNTNYNTPAVPGSVLTKCTDENALSSEEQTKFRSAVGKIMHMMQYSRPEIYNATRDCARHMTQASEKHMKAALRIMKYCVSRPNRGLVLAPTDRWNGSDDFEFVVSGRSDSDYAKCLDTRRSVSGHRVLLNGSPVSFKSGTQKHVSLSVCEAELYAAVTCTQDMLYVRNLLLSLGLQVQLPMILEIDNKGAVDLANNWSIGGRTRHIDVRSCFLRELKELGYIKVIWIAGSENDSDIHTKNLDGPLFEKFTKVYSGIDEYTPKISSKEGVRSDQIVLVTVGVDVDVCGNEDGENIKDCSDRGSENTI